MTRQWWHALTRYLGAIGSVSGWIQRTHHPLLVVMYHHVGPDEKHIKDLYHACPVNQFEADVDFLLQHFRPVDLSTVYRIAYGEEMAREPLVHFTFDDGLKSVQEHAWPILNSRQVPATVFVNSDFVTGPDMLYRMKAAVLSACWRAGELPAVVEESLREHLAGRIPGENLGAQLMTITYRDRHLLDELGSLARVDWHAYKTGHQIYLSMEDLQALHREGLAIGAHSLDHPNLASLPAEEQYHQVATSLQWVASHFPGQPPAFAFPFTDDGLSAATLQSLQQITQPPALLLGTAGIKQERHPGHWQRLPMDVWRGSAATTVPSAYAGACVKQYMGRYFVKRSRA